MSEDEAAEEGKPRILGKGDTALICSSLPLYSEDSGIREEKRMN